MIMSRFPSSLYYYSAFVTGLALAALATLEWGSVLSLSSGALVGLAALATLGVLSESLALTIVIGTHRGTSSITFLPLLVCVLLFGPTVSALFMACTGALAQFFVHRKDVFTGSFNVGQWLLASSLAGMAFQAAGGTPIAGTLDVEYLKWIALPFIVFGVVFLGVNHVAVAGFISLRRGVRFGPVLSQLAGSSGTNLLYDLLVSPIAIVVAFLYSELHVGGLVLILLPMLFIRHSYLTNLRLQQANRDLLFMMVKAIETRDPYTSGHSRRVAAMARRIAEILKLPGRAVESVETAALLHDIGKIDAAYVEILRKPSQLSSEERRIIQSHATIGAELLQSLTSFKHEIVAAVRHHHERYDGSGYPDGLGASAIPLGGRIIMICDSVDAMMSDRPYRRALSLARVQEELYEGKGTQFDPEIISKILVSDLLQRHYEDVTGERGRDVGEAAADLAPVGGRQGVTAPAGMRASS